MAEQTEYIEDDSPDQLHDEVSIIMRTLKEVLSRYQDHPDFLGTELISANQRGAVDDAPLHIAARRGEVEDIAELISFGADVNLRGDLGNTPLHYAALNGNIEAAQKLLQLGADVTLLNEFSETPALVAEQGGHTQVMQVLQAVSKRRC